jgi:hypothetical protein
MPVDVVVAGKARHVQRTISGAESWQGFRGENSQIAQALDGANQNTVLGFQRSGSFLQATGAWNFPLERVMHLTMPRSPFGRHGIDGGFGQGADENLRVGLYARVSTDDQQTLPLQISAMREYAERRGWNVAMQIEEVGSGGKDRPARNYILRAAMRREIDIVLVWKLDRWGGSLLDLVTTLKELHAVGVNFVSLNDSLDFTTPSGQTMAGCWPYLLNMNGTSFGIV